MDKINILEKLRKEFVVENAAIPGVNKTNSVNKKSKSHNNDYYKETKKKMNDYTKIKDEGDTVGKNKFNYETSSQEEYHNDMEIMNGQEMIQYGNEPNERFRERAIKSIEGSAELGNSPEWANVIEKGWGGDPEFGKNLTKTIKRSIKKRGEQTPTTKRFGTDWEVVDEKSQKPFSIKENSEKITNNEEIKKNKSMKKLKFKNEFNGVNNALNLIPEHYKNDKNEFIMTDGVETYKVRWEGSINEGQAIILSAENKEMILENIEKIKKLYSYKSEDTIGNLKGEKRITENDNFFSLYAKTKELLKDPD